MDRLIIKLLVTKLRENWWQLRKSTAKPAKLNHCNDFRTYTLNNSMSTASANTPPCRERIQRKNTTDLQARGTPHPPKAKPHTILIISRENIWEKKNGSLEVPPWNFPRKNNVGLISAIDIGIPHNGAAVWCRSMYALLKVGWMPQKNSHRNRKWDATIGYKCNPYKRTL